MTNYVEHFFMLVHKFDVIKKQNYYIFIIDWILNSDYFNIFALKSTVISY